MKKNMIFLFLVLVFTSCSDFLSESSQDEVRLSQVSDIEELLLGEGYKPNAFYSTEIYTDELQSNGVTDNAYQSEQDRNRFYYKWDKKMFTDEEGGGGNEYWYEPYNCILGCNIVLDYIGKVGGDDNLRENIHGEALTLRSWYYLHLVNLFGVAYNQSDPSKELGVPLKLTSEVSIEYMKRNTVKEVYDQIEKDLLEGYELLKEHKVTRNFYRINHLAAGAILSRLYLYKQDWDNAIKYADEVLKEKSNLLNLNSTNTEIGNAQSFYTVYSIDSPDEIIWGRLNKINHTHVQYGFKPPFTISEKMPYDGSYLDFSDDGLADLRAVYYFNWESIFNQTTYQSDYYAYYASKGKQDDGGFQGIRTAELYLNRAEAYAQKYKRDGNIQNLDAALLDLNKLRSYRYSQDRFNKLTSSNFKDADDLLTFCINERFRELCGETNNRWCDLRRYGLLVTHEFNDEGAVTKYTNNMGKYVLPIPQVALDVNKALIQNQ